MHPIAATYLTKNLQEEIREITASRKLTKFENNIIPENPWTQTECLNEYFRNITNEVLTYGMWLEFGVYKGATINAIAQNTHQTLYGFDTFTGLPESWGEYPEGVYSKDGHLPKVTENVQLIKGLFNDTLPLFLQCRRTKCSFIHIDCDLYSSTKQVLSHLKDRIVKGKVIAFDEFHSPKQTSIVHVSEAKAWREFVKQFGIKYKWIAHTETDQAILKII